MKDIPKILSALGLLDSEIKTYLASLKNGPSTVLEITTSTKLSRQAIYTAIQALTDRGLMSSVLRGKKQYYAAEKPDKLMSYAKRRQDEMNDQIKDLKQAIPELELRAGGEKPVVRMYEGKEGMKAIIENLASSKPKYIQEIGDLDAVYNILTKDDLSPYRELFSKQISKIQSIYAGTPTSTGVKGGKRLLLPNSRGGFKTNITIDDKKVTIVTFEGKLYSMVIENEAIAKTMHILFDLALQSKELKEG